MSEGDLGSLVLRLRAEHERFESELKSAEDRLAGTASRMKRHADGIRAAFQGVAAAFAAAFSARQVAESIRLAQHNLETLAQLRAALRTTGNYSRELEQALTRQAAALELTTGVTDETVIAVQRLLLSLKVSAEQVQELTPLVLDLATALGTDPVNAARMLGRAIGGEMTDGLRRYGITAKTIPGIIADLKRGFEGQAAASFRARGELALMAVLTANLKEELGKLILPSLNRFLEALVQRLINTNAALGEMRARHPDLAASLENLAAVAGRAAAAFGPEALALGGALLAVRAVLFVFGPLIRGINFAFAAMLAPVQGAARALGLTGAAVDRVRALFVGGASAATRLAAAFQLAAAGFGALVAALSGYALGRVISQIQVAGKTIEDHLVAGIFKAERAWARFQAAVGLISEEELAKREAFFAEALKPPPTPAAPEDESGAVGPPSVVAAEPAAVARSRSELFAHMAKLAGTERERLAFMRLQRGELSELVKIREQELAAAAEASRDEEGRVLETERLIEAQSALNKAIEERFELERSIGELERAPETRLRELLSSLGEDPREFAMPLRVAVGADPTLEQATIIQAQMDLEREKIRQLEEFAEREVALTEEAQELKVAAVARANERLRALQTAQTMTVLRAGQDMFDSLGEAARGWLGEQSGVYKAMFAASKAFAIAESIVKIQQGIANAAALPFPANLVAIAQVVAATANIISTIQSVVLTFAGEREKGGPVRAGKLYLVGERGPELFAPATDGTVIPNGALRQGGSVRVEVNNYSEAPVRVREREEGNERVIEILVGRLKRELSGEIIEGTGSVARALERAYGLRRKAA